MIFVINNLKYDTDKMELISDKCEYTYTYSTILFGSVKYSGKNVKVWKSKKNNWLLTYERDYTTCGVYLLEVKAKELLLKYDVEAYEKIFGQLEEA